jgi:hypothetical protein
MDNVKKTSAFLEDDDLKRLKADFVADLRAEQSWRRAKVDYGKFYDGEQLSDEEKRALEERGQPPVVVNRIKPKMDAIFGIQLGLRVDTKAFPVGDKEAEAEDVSQELRRIEDQSAFDDQEAMAFEDLCIDGRAWYKAEKYYAPLRSLENLDAVDKIVLVDNDAIVLDRNTKFADLRTGEIHNSAKRLHEQYWVDLEDAIGMFPEAKEELERACDDPEALLGKLGEELRRKRPDQYDGADAAMGIESGFLAYFVNAKAKRVRIVQTCRRTASYQRILFHKGGFADVTDMSKAERARLTQELEGAYEWTQTRQRLDYYSFTWNAVLEAKRDTRPYDDEGKFGYFLAPGYVERDTKSPYGMIKQQMDPQREVNKRRSKMLHLLNTNQMFFEEGAFEDEGVAKQEIARPDGWVKYRKGYEIQPQKNLDLATSQFQLLQESKNEIDQAGIAREMEGRSPASSGREFQLRQQQAQQGIRKLFMNLRAARRRVALYMLEEILERRPDLAEHVRQYDIVIEEAPDSINLQSETFDKLVQLATGGVMIPPDILLEASPLPKDVKENIVQRMQAVQQQQQAQLATAGGAPAGAAA